MEQGVLESWSKKEGDFIQSGDVLANIETDKAVVEYEILDDCYLRKFLAKPGDTVPVGQPIAIVSEEENDDISALEKEAGNAPAKAPTPIKQPEHDSQASATAHHEDYEAPQVTQEDLKEEGADRVKASPLAANMAAEHGIDLKKIKGSGPRGRIIKADIEAAIKNKGAQPAQAAQAAPAPQSTVASRASAPKAPSVSASDLEGPFTEIPLTGMRKAIARRLTESFSGIPHFFLTSKMRVDALLGMRQQLNRHSGTKISVNDMIIKACGNALMEHPAVNTRWSEEGLMQFHNANIGFAVATPEGLITPIVRAVNQKGLGQIAKETKDLAERAKNKKLKLDEFNGGTFGTSNLGMFGIEQFTAIINPPQSCNLAISAIQDELQLDDENNVIITKQMKMTLACDHRVVDGAVGAAYMKTLKDIIENPLKLML